jgi:hypothetical protein
MIAGRQTMLRYAAGMVIFISCSALLIRAQQSGQVAWFEKVRIKPGEVEKFETTLKRHWTWHEKQGETWSYCEQRSDTLGNGDHGSCYTRSEHDVRSACTHRDARRAQPYDTAQWPAAL